MDSGLGGRHGRGGLGGAVPHTPESDAALDDLLTRVQRIEFLAMRGKLEAIAACAELYIRAITPASLPAAARQDESLAHMFEIRDEALTLLDQQGTIDRSTLDRDRYASLCALVEFAFALRAPQRIEDIHSAL